MQPDEGFLRDVLRVFRTHQVGKPLHQLELRSEEFREAARVGGPSGHQVVLRRHRFHAALTPEWPERYSQQQPVSPRHRSSVTRPVTKTSRDR